MRTDETAFQAMRMFGRFARSKEAPSHTKPGSPLAGRGCLYQFATTMRFISRRFERYRASILARMTAWSAGVRGRESSQPRLFLHLCDPCGLINVRAPSYDQLLDGTWRPATEEEWLMAKPYSYWDIADVGLVTGAWSGFPKLPDAKLQPHLLPIGNTELVCNFSSFVASPALIRSFANAGGPPPPRPGGS